MPLVDLIYRCPLCGADAMREENDRVASCRSCARVYEHVPERGRIRVEGQDGSVQEVDLDDLVAGTARADVSGATDPAPVSVDAVARVAREEEAVIHRKSLIGFVESRGPALSGRLTLHPDRIDFQPDAGADRTWALLDVRAVQTASASVQISPLAGGVVTFRILGDSPRRWEELIRTRLREAWRAAGRGEILEFQPRIRSR
jgi:hypothetical protein